MALRKSKTLSNGTSGDYWRFFNAQVVKNGGSPNVYVSCDIGLYSSEEYSDLGAGALETMGIVFSQGVPLIPVTQEVTQEQLVQAASVIFAYLYNQVRSGNYEREEGQANYFEDAEVV